MKKALSVLLSLIMIISVFAALPLEANAGLYEFLNCGDSKAIIKISKSESYADYGMEIDSDGVLHFDRPYGTPGTSDTTFEPTEYVNITLSWHDGGLLGGWDVSLEHVPTPKRDDNTVQVRDLLDERKVPSGKYDVSVYDEKYHTYDDEHYAHIERYNFSREIYGWVSYISPYDQLDAPTHLRWEDNQAKWEAVPHATEYLITVYNENYDIQFNTSTTNTFYQCVPQQGWSFAVQACDDTGNYINSIWSNGQPLRDYKVTFNANGGSGASYGVIASGKYVLPTTTAYNPPSGGYKFVGWSTTPDGKNISSYINLTENVTVYAVWNQYAGSVDTNVYWSFNDGVLNIYGDGPIQNRTEGYPNPSMFRNNTEIKKVVIGSGITQIGDWFFDGCTGIETVDLSNANLLYRIGNYTFNGCENLSEIIYPSDLGVSITQLGSAAFKGCTKLEGFCLAPIDSTDIQYISGRAFENCTSLKSVTVPKTAAGVAENAFLGCDSLEKIFYGGSLDEWNNLSKGANNEALAGVTVFPYSAWGEQVGDNAYYVVDAFGQTGRVIGTGDMWSFLGGVTSPAEIKPVSEVIVEEGITSIGEGMFYGCDTIKAVTLPSTLKTIGYGAFENCAGLESIVIPDSVKQILDFAFYNCSGLKRVFLGSGLELINYAAFSKCDNLEKVYYIDSFEVFNNKVQFDSNNYSLLNATFIPLSGACGPCHAYMFTPETGTLDIYGSGEMDDFTSTSMPWYDYKNDIKNVVLHGTVTSIGENAFWNCENIETVDFGSKLQKIGKYAFGGCESLTNFVFPDSLTDLGVQAFSNCEKLETVIIPKRITKIPSSIFNGCTSLKTVYIPKSVTSIGVYAFYNCPSLAEIYYSGTEDDFNKIAIESTGNAQLENATVYLMAAPPAISFPDVKETDWFYEAVQYCASLGWITGYKNGKFGPADPLQRQDFVVILARIANAYLPAYTSCSLKDVDMSAYYGPSVAWAVSEGIIKGYDNGKFGVGDKITREQVCTILYRFKGSPSVDTSVLNTFPDKGSVSSFATDAMSWAVANGVITGKNGNLAPVANASRAEIATIIMRMDKNGMF